MIKNILVPERIGQYNIFPKRVLGFYVGKTRVSAAQIHISGKNTIIEKLFSETISPGTTATHDQRVSKAIKNILSHASPYDEIRATISSASVLFKEVSFPFSNPKKIQMVLEYEIESFIPFPTENALADFIITKTEQNNTSIMTAVVQKNQVSNLMSLFKNAGATPSVISVDMFDLYSLYMQIPEYKEANKTTVILDLGFSETKLAYILDGKLQLIRTIPKGILSIAKEFAKKEKLELNDAIEFTLRFGIETCDKPKQTKALQEIFKTFWQTIGLTIESFVTQKKECKKVQQVLVIGEGADIKGVISFTQKELNVETKLFNAQLLAKDKRFSIAKHKHISQVNIKSLAIALETPITDKFSLRKKEFFPGHTSLIIKQVTTTTILILSILAIFFYHTHKQINRLQKVLDDSKREVVATLSKEFKVSKSDKTFKKIVKFAKEEVIKDRNIWFAFSGQTKTSFLKYLIALSDAIDRDGLGLELEKMVMTNDKITLTGKVREHDFEALQILEEELEKTKLFHQIGRPQDTQFSIDLEIVKKDEEL
ncbi:pilus assembly protein PilM [bacterium]|jgi:type IV pilus assembly protein PilM|nr:pilus assembly protein PilM [bacterium]